MRINLTKKDLVNMVYMQIGFSKQISESLIDEFFSLIIKNLEKEKKLRYLNLVLFLLEKKIQGLEETLKQKRKRKFLKEMLFCLNLLKNLENLLILKMMHKDITAYKTIGEVGKNFRKKKRK